MIEVHETKNPNEEHVQWSQMCLGDEQAFAALFKRHYEKLYDYGMKLIQNDALVRDAIQDVFAYIWQKRTTLSPVNSVTAYLLVSLRRMILRTQENNTKLRSAHGELVQVLPKAAFPVEDLIIAHEESNAKKEVLHKAISKIPTRLYEALYLKTYNGLTYKEIATVMDISPGVARNYISEAFQRLRQIMKK